MARSFVHPDSLDTAFDQWTVGALVTNLLWTRCLGRASIAAARDQRLRERLTHARTHSPFYRKRYRELPADAPLSELPPVAQSALMAAFDVYVNTSTYEGVSLTILEAMASSLPVVATPAGGNPEVVIDNETGRLVSGTARAMAAALVDLAGHPMRRHTMGDAGRWRVKRHFSLERMVEQYAAAYFGMRHMANSAAPSMAPAICAASPASPIGCDPIAS